MTDLQSELIEMFGDDIVKIDKLECSLYGHDAAPLPAIMMKNYKTLPDAVVRPNTAEQVAELVGFAHAHAVPIIPRGKGTTMLGGTLPVFGGIVLDLSSLNRIVAFSAENQTVVAGAGVSCAQLLEYLQSLGREMQSYPSSAPSATLGGWLSHAGMGAGRGGLGIGSSCYGYAADQVCDLEVVLPDGQLIHSVIASPLCQLEDFLGTDGICGIITKIVLKTAPLQEVRRAFSFSFTNLMDLGEVVEWSSSLKPLYVVFEDEELLQMKKKAGLSVPLAAKNVADFVFSGNLEAVEEKEELLRKIAMKFHGIYLGDAVSAESWQERFYPMRVKKAGPTILGSEFAVPKAALTAALDRIEELKKQTGLTLGIHGVLGVKEVLLMPQMLCDERKTMHFIPLMSIVKELNELSISFGGCPYGVGLFNAFYANYVHDDVLALKKRKKELDADNIMNPGKGIRHFTRFGIPVPKIMYCMTMDVLRAVRKLV